MITAPMTDEGMMSFNRVASTKSFPCPIYVHKIAAAESALRGLAGEVTQWLQYLRRESRVLVPVTITWSQSSTPRNALVTAHVDFDPEGPASQIHDFWMNGRQLPFLQPLIQTAFSPGDSAEEKVLQLSSLADSYLSLLRAEGARHVRVDGRVEFSLGDHRVFMTVVRYLHHEEVPLP